MRFDKIYIILLGLITIISWQMSDSGICLNKPNMVDGKLLEVKQGIGKVYHGAEVFTGTAARYYSNGNRASTIEYVDGKKSGYYRKWFDDKLLSFECYYKSGKREGESRTWWRNGQLRSLSRYKKGIAHGIQEEWYKEGQKFTKMQLVQGQEFGLQQAWRKNGQLYNNYEAKDGRIYGLKRSKLCYELQNENITYSD